MFSAPFGSWNPASARAATCRSPRRPLEIVGLVFLFFYSWPVAAAFLAWKLLGYPVPAEARQLWFDGIAALRGRGWAGAWSAGGSGNLAFDAYRRSEIERLERERRRLDEEAQEFRSFVDDLKRAKDREEFDAYMRRRGTGTAV